MLKKPYTSQRDYLNILSNRGRIQVFDSYGVGELVEKGIQTSTLLLEEPGITVTESVNMACFSRSSDLQRSKNCMWKPDYVKSIWVMWNVLYFQCWQLVSDHTPSLFLKTAFDFWILNHPVVSLTALQLSLSSTALPHLNSSLSVLD